ncbi:MAG: nitronate monooxygenase [Legionellaceae bacterium]|nr:nitronate monooxygenase [Legionellaceae bacterium]
MKIKTRLCDLLNLSVPIFQAPMGGATTPRLASAVANYGGLGMLPLGAWPMEKCEKLIDETSALTDQAIGVNLVLEWDQHERLEMSLKKGIKIIWFFWGDPSPFVEKIHAQGGKVILTVGSAAQAKLAIDAGVDVIVTQGWEAGGHIWGEVATMPLVPTVVDVVDGKVPVVAAGGIADGRGMAAAMALGAEGIVLGTRLLASHEAGIHEQYKNRILNAKETDTVYTDLFDKGWPNSYMRVLRNSTYDQWVKADKPPSGKRPGEHDIITQFCPGSPVERYTHNLPAPMMEGDLEPLAQYAGQCVGLVKKRQSVHEILDEVVADAIKRINVCQALVF